MRNLPLPNLHDASIEGFTFVRDTARLIVNVSKYAIDKEPEIHMQLIFSGIMNVDKVAQFDQLIRKTLQKGRRSNLGYGIDNLAYGNLSPFEQGLSLLLDIDHLGILRINCRKLSIHNV